MDDTGDFNSLILALKPGLKSRDTMADVTLAFQYQSAYFIPVFKNMFKFCWAKPGTLFFFQRPIIIYWHRFGLA
jgi:hypothetical protein